MLTINQIYNSPVIYTELLGSRIWHMRGSDIFSMQLTAFYHSAERLIGTFLSRTLITQIKQHIDIHHQDGLLRHHHVALFSLDGGVGKEKIHQYLLTLAPDDRALLYFTLYSGYSIAQAKQLTWAQIDDIWYSLSPVVRALIQKQMRNTQSDLVFSLPTAQGYTLPALTADDIVGKLGASHQTVVASFMQQLLSQPASQSDAMRQQLGIEGI